MKMVDCIFKKIISFILALTILVGLTQYHDVNAATENDLTSIIESVKMLKDKQDLFGKDESTFTSAVLQVKLNYNLDSGIKINSGDTLSVMLVPEDYGKNFISIETNTSLLNNLEDKGVKIADLNMKSRKGVEFTFADVATSFKAELNMPFKVSDNLIQRYFRDNPTETKVSFSYKLQIDGKDTGKILRFNVSKPTPTPVDENFVKTRGLYKQDGKLGEGEMIYNLQLGSKLNQYNELVIYDTPDVNLGFDGSLSVWDASKLGGLSYKFLKEGENYYKESGNIADEYKMEIFIYDIYYLTEDHGESSPRQAEWEEKKITLPRKDAMTGADTQESVETAIVPKNILLEKMSGEALTQEEQKLVDDNGGLYKTVGKGFKIRIKNYKSQEFNPGGFITIVYNMTIKNNSPIVDTSGFPVYLNSAAYYMQEIPTCTLDNKPCPPIKAEKTKSVEQVEKTRANVNPGSVGVVVDKYSDVDFTKVQSDENGKPDLTKPLSGAKFNIYKVVDAGADEIAVNKDGVKMENLITNADGKLCLDNDDKTLINLRLERGSYIFEEISAPKGFVINDKQTNVVVGLLENIVAISNSAEAENKYEVTYRFESVDKGKVLPEAVLKLLPAKEANIKDGTQVVAKALNTNKVETEDGVWTFQGWDKDRLTINGANAEFIGLWDFADKTYKIDTEVVNGTISESLTDIKKGENKEITYSPNKGYVLDYIQVDGKNVDIDKFKDAYSFDNISDNHFIKVVYKVEKETVTKEPSKPTNTGKPEQAVKSIHATKPNTGDNTNIMLYIGGIIVSIVLIYAVGRKRRLNKNR